LRPDCLALILILLVRLPSWSQEATAVGLKGRVHTVRTEDFSNENGESRESRGSTLEVYDRHGYQLEIYRYKPDGSLWVHTIFSRNGEKILKMQTTGAAPFENVSVQNVFDSDGSIIETDTYDADGVLTKKSLNEFLEKRTESNTYRSIEMAGADAVNTREVVESTDHKTGITHQIATMNGKPETDWVIQRDGDGVPEKDKIIYADGSYNERERRPDGTTVEDRYSASTKSHTYQTSDKRGNLTEVVQRSDSDYIRCTYSYDETGRPTGQTNYDVYGKILDKTTTEYQDDSSGNWTEKKGIVWDTTSEPMKQKMVVTSLRTINYYSASAPDESDNRKSLESPHGR
jgi:YD repeat-containing protein